MFHAMLILLTGTEARDGSLRGAHDDQGYCANARAEMNLLTVNNVNKL